MEKVKVKALIIFEMMGKPKEYLNQTMEQLIDTVSKEPNLKLINKKISEPKEIERKDKEGNIIKDLPTSEILYSVFSELEFEFNDIFMLMQVCFKYMPSHVEIYYPEKFDIRNMDMSSILSSILTRLHQYDAVAKSALMNNQILAAKINELKGLRPNNVPVVEESKSKENTKKPLKKKKN